MHRSLCSTSSYIAGQRAGQVCIAVIASTARKCFPANVFQAGYVVVFDLVENPAPPIQQRYEDPGRSVRPAECKLLLHSLSSTTGGYQLGPQGVQWRLLREPRSPLHVGRVGHLLIVAAIRADCHCPLMLEQVRGRGDEMLVVLAVKLDALGVRIRDGQLRR